MQIVKVTGHTAWWVFVVARLMSELGLTLTGAPTRYADHSTDSGWTAYTALTDLHSSSWTDPFAGSNILSTVAVVALVTTVFAAIAVAVLNRRLWSGIATVAAPAVGGIIVLWVLEQRAGYAGGGMNLPLLVVFAVVLLGIAIRELGSRHRINES